MSYLAESFMKSIKSMRLGSENESRTVFKNKLPPSSEKFNKKQQMDSQTVSSPASTSASIKDRDILTPDEQQIPMSESFAPEDMLEQEFKVENNIKSEPIFIPEEHENQQDSRVDENESVFLPEEPDESCEKEDGAEVVEVECGEDYQDEDSVDLVQMLVEKAILEVTAEEYGDSDEVADTEQVANEPEEVSKENEDRSVEDRKAEVSKRAEAYVSRLQKLKELNEKNAKKIRSPSISVTVHRSEENDSEMSDLEILKQIKEDKSGVDAAFEVISKAALLIGTGIACFMAFQMKNSSHKQNEK
mmetsp:Transcript_33252/g.33870  ORF Transcript_33252/g.33870 Transcript_33252/m.33870 type:complete len:303 (-) Transcript_33252:20-928(-)